MLENFSSAGISLAQPHQLNLRERYDSVLVHLRRTSQRPWWMYRHVDVIPPDPIDGARQ